MSQHQHQQQEMELQAAAALVSPPLSPFSPPLSPFSPNSEMPQTVKIAGGGQTASREEQGAAPMHPQQTAGPASADVDVDMSDLMTSPKGLSAMGEGFEYSTPRTSDLNAAVAGLYMSPQTSNAGGGAWDPRRLSFGTTTTSNSYK
eukprot:gene20601-27400_t